MGKKRKLGKLDEAQPHAAELKKQKPVVVSVDDAGKPLDPAKQIGLIHPEVLPNPNEVAVQAFTNPPVPEIEAGPEEPPPKKKRKKSKKQKLVDICVDVAGKASEPSKEVGLVQAKPAEVPPPNSTVGVEIEARPAALLLPNPVAKGEEKSEEARMIPELKPKTEEVTVKKKKKKKLREQMEMQSTVTAQCGDDVENNGEAKSVEEDEPPKKRKKNKKQKLGGLMEMQGNVATCVNDVEKSGEAKINGVFRKPAQVVAAMEGSKDTVTVCVGVENKSRITFSVDDAGQIVEGKTSADNKEEKRKEKKSTEEKVDEKKKESTNEKAEGQTIKFLQVCVICREKGHIISTCPLLNQAQTNKKKSGNKLPECSQPLHHVELKNGEAEPENILVKGKSSDCKEGESIVMNDEVEKLLFCPPMDTLMKEKTSGVEENKSTVKNGEESSCNPEDIVMKDENTDDREGKTIVKVDCASHPEECYVKRMTEQGPEAVHPVA